VLCSLRVGFERDDIVSLFDGGTRLDGAKPVEELNETKVYKVGLRCCGSASSMPNDPSQLGFISSESGTQPLGHLDALSEECHRATALGDLVTLKKFRGKPEILNSPNENGVAPLHVAASGGNTSCVSLLVKLGADANQLDLTGVTPIFLAAWRGHLEVVRVLLRLGADLRIRSRTGKTPLIMAAIGGCAAIVRDLALAGCDRNAADVSGFAAMHVAAAQGHVDVVRELGRLGADPQKAACDGCTPLCLAAQAGQVEVVEELVKLGASVHTRARDGATPLFLAAEAGQVEVIRALVKFGADVNTAAEEGVTPVLTAATHKHEQVVLELVRFGACMNDGDASVLLGLVGVSRNCQSDMVRWLLGLGAGATLPWLIAVCSLLIARGRGHAAVLSRLAGWRYT
jgi:ankyrin repeat protein